MSQNVIQTNFASGELSPNLFARVDIDQYRSGAAMMRNFFVDYRSGCSTRAGTALDCQAFNSAFPVRLIPFQTSVLTPYILEFGDHYMRPHSLGAPVLEAGFVITAISTSNPVIITAPGHNFNVGDWFTVVGANGMVQLDNRFFTVGAVSGANISVLDTYGNQVNGTNYTPWINGGSVQRLFTVTSSSPLVPPAIAPPYAGADLALLKYVQVANTMYLTHPSYPPTLLTFTGPTGWTFTTITFGSTANTPTVPVLATSSAGSANYAYVVTAIDATGAESLPSPPGTIGSAVDIGSTAGTITGSGWSASGAVGYNVYKAELSLQGPVVLSAATYGFIQSVRDTAFADTNFVPDFTQTPPTAQNPVPLIGVGNYPSCCCFFQQRLYYAGSNNNPQTFWASQPGLYNNFNISSPIQADDAITGTLVSLQVNFIKAMVPMPGGLILLTANGAWQLSSGAGGLASTAAVTPINATATPQAYNGISDVQPIIINEDLLYVQYKNSLVRDLVYNIYANIYTGTDISVMSNHLFFGYQILQWAYAEEPFKVVWAIRNDGTALSLTFLKEQGLKGWARHDTQGLFKSVATVTEGNLDATYFVVQRSINGVFWQFVERMDERQMVYGAEDAWVVDCGSQSGLTTYAATMSATGSTGSVTFTASAPVIPANAVGMIIRMGGGIATVTGIINTSQVTATITQPITQLIPGTSVPLPQPSGSWTMTLPFTTFVGLDYLNGMTVAILADGNVQTPQVVTNGSITLQEPATKVTVGLAFTAQLQTMPLDLGDVRDSIQGKRKKIAALSIRMSQTRGLSYGHNFSNLTQIKEFNQGQAMGTTIPLMTGDERVIMDPLWDVPGQICLQQDNPLPATVLGVIPEIVVGDTIK